MFFSWALLYYNNLRLSLFSGDRIFAQNSPWSVFLGCPSSAGRATLDPCHLRGDRSRRGRPRGQTDGSKCVCSERIPSSPAGSLGWRVKSPAGWRCSGTWLELGAGSTWLSYTPRGKQRKKNIDFWHFCVYEICLIIWFRQILWHHCLIWSLTSIVAVTICFPTLKYSFEKSLFCR